MNHDEVLLHTDLAGILHILVDPRRRLEYTESCSPVDVMVDLASVTAEEQPRRDLLQASFKGDREWLQKSEWDALEMDATVGMMNAFGLLPGSLDRNDSEEDLAMMKKLFSLLQEDYQTRVHAETQQLIANKYMIGTLKAIALFTTHKDPTKPLPQMLISQPLAVMQNAVEEKHSLQADLETIGEDRDALETQLKVYRTSLVNKDTDFEDIDDAALASKLEDTLRNIGAGKDGVHASDNDHNKTNFDDIDDAVYNSKAGEALRDLGAGSDDVHAWDDDIATFLQEMAFPRREDREAEEPPEEERDSVETAADALLNDESVAAVWNQMVEMRKKCGQAQGE